MKQKKKKSGVGIVFKSVSGIVFLLGLFSAMVSVIGFSGFTDALLKQYTDDAFHTADTASLLVEPEHMEEYVRKGWQSEQYKTVWNHLDSFCNSSGSTFIYVIRPDLSDYGHITFVFSTIDHDSSFTVYDFGYVRETTNDEYKEKYRRLYAGTSTQELVIRDRGYIETAPHITAMVPLKDTDGKTTAILCVQRQMDVLTTARNAYIKNVLIVLIILVLFVIAIQSIYLNAVCLRPIKQITAEASRFAEENTAIAQKLTDTIHNKDEIGILAESIDRMEERIVSYVQDLTRITAERERISTELSLATKIQVNMLPNTFPPFPERKGFDIFASMEPAKEVGGDFYDFFLVDDNHLCMVIADVSGKGVPSALFMMSSKIILANYAKMGNSPQKIMEATNETICANNREDMFVTVWLGILEITTGRLKAVNAGHEYPILKQPDGKFELFKDKHGFVVGGMDGLRYKEYEIMLQKGAKLFLYTDGIPEATNSEKKMFGSDGILSALNRMPDAAPEQLLHNVRKAVDGFVKEAEQFDDMTMLCLEYKGNPQEEGKCYEQPHGNGSPDK